MDGVFVSLVMNGPHTWVHIRQFAGEGGSVNNVIHQLRIVYVPVEGYRSVAYL